MAAKTITVPLNPAQVATRTLLAGLSHGFNFAAYEIYAVDELIRRGQSAKLIALYESDKPLRKLARAAIRRQLNLKRR